MILKKRFCILFRKVKFIAKKYSLKSNEFNKKIPKRSFLELSIFIILIFIFSLFYLNILFKWNIHLGTHYSFFIFIPKFLGLTNCFLYSYRHLNFIFSIETKKWNDCKNLDDYNFYFLINLKLLMSLLKPFFAVCGFFIFSYLLLNIRDLEIINNENKEILTELRFKKSQDELAIAYLKSKKFALESINNKSKDLLSKTGVEREESEALLKEEIENYKVKFKK